MADEQPSVLRLQVGTVTKTFRSFHEVRDWVKAQQERWRPLANRLTWGQSMWTTWNSNIEAVLAPYLQTELTDESAARFSKKIRGHLDNVLDADSPEGHFVFTLLDKEGAEAAVAAGAYLAGRREDLASKDIIKGTLLAFAHEVGLDPKFDFKSMIATQVEGMEQWFQRQRDAIEHVYDLLVAREAEARRALEEFAAASRETQETQHHHLSASIQGMQVEADKRIQIAVTQAEKEAAAALEDTKKQLQALTETYDRHMVLKAPSNYWKHKATEHQKLSAYFAWAFGIGVVVLGGGAIATTALLLPDSIATMSPSHVGVSIVAVTLVFWVLKILARNLISHIHLATDAHERRTMIVTYLALTRRSRTPSNEEMRIILEPIFRPTADGLVKDDPGPPFANIVNKHVEG